ncbi:MAG: ribosomal RNA small subunit methyltransferase A [Bdellovibrionales bacterium]|nr:ribosomal RNA small subunit methyltransferase A [Bdellovibrionales bacterium]
MKVKSKLKEYGVKPSKERGQNFLIDDSVIDEIIKFGKPSEKDQLIEIGPGLGALTKSLQNYGNLTVIEIEEKFCKPLAEKYPHIKIINSDVRFVDFLELGDDLVVFGNLPYSFSTEILFFLIDTCPNVKKAVLLLQKEFADRLAASPGTKDYGVLTISTQLKANVYSGPIIPGNCFHPPTKVDSRIVELRMLEKPRVEIEDLIMFKRVVSASFYRRRKKIPNSLKSSGLASSETITQALKEANINTDLRPEDLSLGDYAALSKALVNLSLNREG